VADDSSSSRFNSSHGSVARGKTHEVALSHLMRILTRRLVAVLRSGKPYSSNYNLALQSAL